MSLLDRIKTLAKSNGLTIKSLESCIGLGNGTIRRWDNSPPSADKLLKVANMLNTSMDYLMTGEEILPTTLPLALAPGDSEWLSLIHQLPEKAQYEFLGEIKGYLKCLNEKSVAADEMPSKKTGTTNTVK